MDINVVLEIRRFRDGNIVSEMIIIIKRKQHNNSTWSHFFNFYKNLREIK